MKTEGAMVVFAISVSMIYFCWIMSPKQLIIKTASIKQKQHQQQQHQQPQQQKQLFILAGQSNMMGVGGVTKIQYFNGVAVKVWDGVVPPENQPNPAVFRLNGKLKWEIAHEPLHYEINCKATCGLGIGMPFANKLLELAPDFGPVGLVPCGFGGTSVANWSGDYPDAPYRILLMRSKAAIKSGGNLRGVIWYQGESDVTHSYNAKNYKMWLEKFINRYRNDIQLPTVPFFQIIIPRLKKPWKYVEEIRKIQREINLPNIIKVNADGLPMIHDGVHLTIEGYTKLGHTLADVVLKTYSLLSENKPLVSIYNASDSQL